MVITIERNQKIQNLQIKDNIYIYIYIYMWVCGCVCDYTTEKYTRNMCYHQKNNSVKLNLINHFVGFIPCQICLYFSNYKPCI